MEFTTRPHGRSNLDQNVQGRLTTATSWGVQKLETTCCPSWPSDNLKDGLTGKFALAIASLDVARFESVLSLSVKFVMHFIAFLGKMHTDREEGASSSLLYKRASRCQHVSSLSRLNKTILANYSRFNKIATLAYIMAHEGMGTGHYSMSRLTMRRS